MRLDISIGPVQGFVAQSRRTRDLWGSSYLLSFLSAHAIRGAEQAGGTIIQPVVANDPLYRWVCGHREGKPPRIGSVPNRFVVNVEGNARDIANAGKQALYEAWQQAYETVRKHFVECATPVGCSTDSIWNRQVHGFWEIMWTAENGSATRGLLTRRKHWRSHRPPEEPGDKCTVMHDFQELSGYVRGSSLEDRKNQDEFWKTVRESKGIGPLDLRDNERLCAVALVKRLFPKVANEALGWEVDASHWPSTVYVGAVPWIRQVVQSTPESAREYADVVRQNTTGVLAERAPLFTDIENEKAGDFAKLDANYLHREFVTSKRSCPLNDDSPCEAREILDRLLKDIYDTTQKTGKKLGPPPTFYAVLLADGDRLGKLVGSLDGEAVSNALASFHKRGPKIVHDHGGVVVYAGGDDVLAMLPVPDALTCADKLADVYRAAFKDADTPTPATLSAAVVLAQVRLPLNHVLGVARRLLDDVAKDRNGRNSLTAAVLKPGDMHCQWVTTWVRSDSEGNVRAVELLGKLVKQLEGNRVEPGLSSSLIYRIRDTLTRLCGWDQWQPGTWGNVPQGLDIHAFLKAEIHHSLDVRMDGVAETHADRLTASVWSLLGSARNSQVDEPDAQSGNRETTPIMEVGVDALLLARFLAQSDPQEPV